MHSGIGTPALHSSFRALTSSSRPEDPSGKCLHPHAVAELSRFDTAGVEFNAVVEFWEFLTNSDGPKFEEVRVGIIVSPHIAHVAGDSHRLDLSRFSFAFKTRCCSDRPFRSSRKLSRPRTTYSREG